MSGFLCLYFGGEWGALNASSGRQAELWVSDNRDFQRHWNNVWRLMIFYRELQLLAACFLIWDFLLEFIFIGLFCCVSEFQDSLVEQLLWKVKWYRVLKSFTLYILPVKSMLYYYFSGHLLTWAHSLRSY